MKACVLIKQTKVTNGYKSLFPVVSLMSSKGNLIVGDFGAEILARLEVSLISGKALVGEKRVLGP
ncbi:hypothetical protein CUMW_047190 [Citrus unshiu]|nr:hypothetical protein CUMW_047190 [Citrus unshiu]